MPLNELEHLWETLKTLKNNIRLLPQYQTASERAAFMSGKLEMSDINIDLDTPINDLTPQQMNVILNGSLEPIRYEITSLQR